MIGTTAYTSFVTSTKITARVSVIRVTPPSIAADPSIANLPASTIDVAAPSAPFSSCPTNRPSAAPTVIAGMKLPAGTAMPKAKAASGK